MHWGAKRETTTARTHARAALVGNPSDGYGGRTIAFTFEELKAEVTVAPAPRLIVDAERGEGALLRAAYGRFASHCFAAGASPVPCSLRVRSSIPPAVGLAGSSAIVIAALRALCVFNGVEVPDAELPTVALAAEEDLDIPAGLQDRVAQVYDGLVYMDFDPAHLEHDGHGTYERLDPGLLPYPYVAWCERATVPSARFHGELRRRFQAGDQEVVKALDELAELALHARGALLDGDADRLGAIVDANFDLRRKLGPLEPMHVQMIEVARSVGACANYAGSGGAITGFVSSQRMLGDLYEALGALGCTVIEPTVAHQQAAAVA
jgi:glucuronokinase